ncbi:putative zinc finger CCHC domain-containing protein 10-like [Apostichopus japonicus]|uniref:Putative zinc finger CCHC domain-containing protein 10-like n=1 Tax=Stichopus japonicus TaxID=307972 RepID=A0A2G8KH78_STIJA|nr:putative zinc finger CCHC domain-containing protein 10-like [Apostichopus japonicus]
MKNNSVKFVDNNYDASVVLKAIATDIGKENIMGCVKTQGLWIVTLRKKEDVELLQAKSLPYAIIVSGIHLRLKHNGQLRVCNLCLSEFHILRDCSHYCYRSCGQQGHTARRCPTIRCYKCNKDGHKSFQCPENRKEDNVTVAGNPNKDEQNKDEMQQQASPIVTEMPTETSFELNLEANSANEKCDQNNR